MYCPKCGQQQVSEKGRFCRRCGFSLRGVLSARRNEVILGLLVMLIGFVGLDFLHGMSLGIGEALKEITGREPPDLFHTVLSVAFVVGGLVWILYVLFVERSLRSRHRLEASREKASGLDTSTVPDAQSYATARREVLPESHGTPITHSTIPGAGTVEGLPELSVAEPTTRLLGKEPPSPDGER